MAHLPQDPVLDQYRDWQNQLPQINQIYINRILTNIIGSIDDQNRAFATLLDLTEGDDVEYRNRVFSNPEIGEFFRSTLIGDLNDQNFEHQSFALTYLFTIIRSGDDLLIDQIVLHPEIQASTIQVLQNMIKSKDRKLRNSARDFTLDVLASKKLHLAKAILQADPIGKNAIRAINITCNFPKDKEDLISAISNYVLPILSVHVKFDKCLSNLLESDEFSKIFWIALKILKEFDHSNKLKIHFLNEYVRKILASGDKSLIDPMMSILARDIDDIICAYSEKGHSELALKNYIKPILSLRDARINQSLFVDGCYDEIRVFLESTINKLLSSDNHHKQLEGLIHYAAPLLDSKVKYLIKEQLGHMASRVSELLKVQKIHDALHSDMHETLSNWVQSLSNQKQESLISQGTVAVDTPLTSSPLLELGNSLNELKRTDSSESDKGKNKSPQRNSSDLSKENELLKSRAPSF